MRKCFALLKKCTAPLWLALALVLALGLCACSAPVTPAVSDSTSESTTQTTTLPQTTEPPKPVRLRIAAVGDNLLHNTVSKDCLTDGGEYDYSKLYENLAPLLAGCDVAFINEEVPLAGEIGAYPSLSAAGTVAQALRGAGFNVVNQASNHSLDKGQKGLVRSLDTLNETGFDAILGAFRTEEEANAQQIIEKQGVRIGFLSYTYGLNGYSLPQDKPWMVSLIDNEKIKSDLAALRPNCDYLIVSMHWGNEYQTEPSDGQRTLAQMLADEGADLIIGHHPHVLQPLERLTAQDGREVPCVYSLGNYVSGQHKRATMLGGLLSVEVDVYPDGRRETAQAGVVPLVTHYESKAARYAVIPLDAYTEELAAVHGIKNFTDPVSLGYFDKLAQQVLGEARLTSEELSSHEH